MSPLTPEQSAFLRSICENPSDDTIRLVYADYLEEHDELERAELIRIQVELGPYEDGRVCPPAIHTKRIREKQLQDILSAQLSAKCPVCGGTGRVKAVLGDGTGGYSAPCPTCGGTGDLFRRFTDDRTHAKEPRPHRFVRGLLYLLVELEEVVVACPDCTDGRWRNGRDGCCRTCDDVQWCPTPWAAALPPEVVGLWVTDKHPDDKWWWWRDGDGTYRNNWAYLPSSVFNHLPGVNTGNNGMHFDSAHLARLHLAHALRLWIYDYASQDKTTT